MPVSLTALGAEAAFVQQQRMISIWKKVDAATAVTRPEQRFDSIQSGGYGSFAPDAGVAAHFDQFRLWPQF